MLNNFFTELRLSHQAQPLLVEGWKYPYQFRYIFLFFIFASSAFISIHFISNITGFLIFCLSLVGIALSAKKIYRNRFGFKLLKFIQLIGFYDDENSSRVNFVYKRENEKLKIAFSGQGKWGDKINKLSIQLQDLIGYPVIGESLTINNWYCYTLLLNPSKRYKVDSVANFDDLMKNFYRTEFPVDTQTTIDFKIASHMLIAGQTGSGKTYFISWILMILAKRHINFSIIDAKSSDLSQLGQIIGANKVATTAPQAAALLRQFSAEMDERYRQLNNVKKFGADWQEICLRPKFLVFDEVAALMAIADKKTGQEIMNYLKNLILKGRQAGMFVIISTQRPDAEALDTAIRDQLGVRIALGTLSPIGYSMVFGKNYDSLVPVEGKGVGYCLIDGSGMSQPIAIKTPSYGISVPKIINNYQKNID